MTTLPSNITVEELMDVDYKFFFTGLELENDWARLCTTEEYKKGAQFKPGMKLCQHFCENFFSIRNNKGLSFEDAWKDPKVMEKVLSWGKKGMSKLWLSWVRRAVYMSSGLPNSSFYRPHFARQLTQMHGKDKGVLFDPCFGWGGRMLGTISNDWKYIGCDPNELTHNNVLSILDFIGGGADLYNIPAEEFDYANQAKVDVVLTSPPYYDLEVYSSEDNQAYTNYPSYESWRDGWLSPLIADCISILQDDGISAWNAMNFQKNDFVGDIIQIHKDLGWELVNTLGFDSPLANIRNLKNKDQTYIFRKDHI